MKRFSALVIFLILLATAGNCVLPDMLVARFMADFDCYAVLSGGIVGGVSSFTCKLEETGNIIQLSDGIKL